MKGEPVDVRGTFRILLQLSQIEGQLQEAGSLAAVNELRCDEDRSADAARAALEEQKRLLLAELPADLAAAYQLLARKGRHPVLVPIVNGYCSACHLRIPRQIANAIASGREFGCCPHCRRFLYAPPRQGSPGA